ncbi:phage terminase large subunit [Sphingobium sp. PNB]|uniref:PBSX family phage terminase large subunit n=1 Tax=Sphingobium sp. PNB TaxID=863934 RepID=UPI001CA3AE8B|nr:phage terminase large subunit [Sphingobium sp. PNB]MCB4860780.1 phage terminase large subunit [Sphingobium sp. PNB]
MASVQIEIPDKLVPVFEGEADVRGSHGGRGSAKSRTFAKMTAVRTHMWDQQKRTGVILCGRQFMNSLADSSMEEIKAAIRSEPWLAAHFDIGETYIRTKSGRIKYVFSGLDRNIDSIKSTSRILLAWIEEAENVTEEAWVKLIPTLREEDSELWLTWNPERETSATNKRFRNPMDPRTKIVEMNWRDNPWFPEILNRQRLKDQKERPHIYGHIWEGEYLSALEGAYFGEHLRAAKEEDRIAFVPEDPHMVIRLYADIGGTGAKADNFVFWAAQFIGLEIRVVNHYEVQGQPIAAHLNWMRSQGYTPDRCKIWLPHDGDTNDRVFDVSYRSAFEAAGYTVEVVPNQGKGAAAARIEEARKLFPRVRFDEVKTEAGRKALGWYHEKKDEKRDIGLGPEHDWASHSADAYGLMCVAYEEPRAHRPIRSGMRVGVV